jgi:DNA-binding response OmpR family regulator
MEKKEAANYRRLNLHYNSIKIFIEKNNLDVEVVNDSTKAFDVARKGDFDLIYWIL